MPVRVFEWHRIASHGCARVLVSYHLHSRELDDVLNDMTFHIARTN
jgi:hypothetical protein